jgi:hypothetical protein
LLLNVTPLGSAPASVSVGTGDPVVVTVKLPAAPTVDVVLPGVYFGDTRSGTARPQTAEREIKVLFLGSFLVEK